MRKKETKLKTDLDPQFISHKCSIVKTSMDFYSIRLPSPASGLPASKRRMRRRELDFRSRHPLAFSHEVGPFVPEYSVLGETHGNELTRPYERGICWNYFDYCLPSLECGKGPATPLVVYYLKRGYTRISPNVPE